MRRSELVKLLKKNGCYFFREGGRHDIWYSPITKNFFPLERHSQKEIATGTLNEILKEAGIKK